MTIGGIFKANAGANRMLCSTFNTVLTNVGMFVRFAPATNRLQWIVSDGTGTAVINLTVDGPFTAGVVHTWAIDFMDRTPGVGASGTDDFRAYVDNALVASGELGTVEPSAAAPQAALYVGRRSTASELFDGTMGGLVWFAGETRAQELCAYLETLRA
jgi:hypothetical protein